MTIWAGIALSITVFGFVSALSLFFTGNPLSALVMLGVGIVGIVGIRSETSG
jgi:hypothetical protein